MLNQRKKPAKLVWTLAWRRINNKMKDNNQQKKKYVLLCFAMLLGDAVPSGIYECLCLFLVCFDILLYCMLVCAFYLGLARLSECREPLLVLLLMSLSPSVR